ncbi:MAG TPA: hypothetical protein VMX13_04375 [Sedimentisphaerales bacterium]|nr:hypothetical protein [Sedimentisphaerales bacterium]
MVRTSFVISAGCVLILAGFAQGDSPFNVDVFWGWDYCYRPMEWTPVVVGISSTLTEPFQGSVSISAHQDGLNSLNITHGFVLTPDLPAQLPLVTKLAFAVDKCDVRIVEVPGGRTRWNNNFDLMDFSTRQRVLTPVDESDLFIGLVGHQRFGLTQLSRKSLCLSHYGSGRVHVAVKLPQTVPWDWTGFACLDLLILYDPDWTLFNKYHLGAIAQWVANGGKLFLILGTNPLSSDNPIAGVLPCQLDQPKEVTLSAEILAKWNLSANDAERVTVWPLQPKPDVPICYSQTDDGVGLFTAAKVGFGKVAVLAFDPSTLSDLQKVHACRFWANRIAAVLADIREAQAGAKEQGPRKYEPTAIIGCPLTGDQVHLDRSKGGIEMTIGGLETGKYRIISYHNNPFAPRGPFGPIDIYVNGALYSRNNRQTEVYEDEKAATAVTEFRVLAPDAVAIEFRAMGSESHQRAMLCGFELFKLPASENDKTAEDIGERTLAVDFGAKPYLLAPGFIGLGLPMEDRRPMVEFGESDGLPSGMTIAVSSTNKQDDIQFRPNAGPIYRRGGERVVPPHFAAERSIEFVEDAESALTNRDQHAYQVGGAQVASNEVMKYLYSISEMRPLSIWWVILLLAALAVLLGPVDYTILKRRDRLPLTWLTCAVWIALFTGGAYYGVQELRGGKMQARVVSVLDAIADEECAWSTVYCGLFAPKSDDYRLDGLRENQWWSGIAPSEESLYDYRPETGTRNIYCVQQEGYNQPYSLPINIWTMQCLLDESPLGDFPFTARLTRTGDQFVLDVTNLSDSPIVEGYVVFGDEMALDFGAVGANAGGRFEGRPHRRDSWVSLTPQHRTRSLEYELAYYARGSLQRTEAIKKYLDNGAAVVCARYNGAPAPFSIKDRTCAYHHVQLARLVVFPEEEKEPRNDPNQKSQ